MVYQNSQESSGTGKFPNLTMDADMQELFDRADRAAVLESFKNGTEKEQQASRKCYLEKERTDLTISCSKTEDGLNLAKPMEHEITLQYGKE